MTEHVFAPAPAPEAILLSLLRRSEGLSAWVSYADAADDSGQGAVTLRRIALDDLAAALLPQREALLADWRALAAARELDTVWPAFWRIFWHTLSDAGAQTTAPMPRQVAPPGRPAATAAHPRAFRGTKIQPPKAPLPALDLCAWLAHDRVLDGFLARHVRARLPILAPDGRPLAWSGPAPTVAALLAWRARSGASAWPLLPDVFRAAFLWRLRAQPLADMLAWLRLWRALGSPPHGEALALAARLCALDQGAHAWAALALHLDQPRRLHFLAAVLARRAWNLPIASFSPDQVAQLDRLAATELRFRQFLDAILLNLHRKVGAAYTLIGCQLSNRASKPDREPSLQVAAGAALVPLDAIDRIGKVMGPDGDYWQLAAWKNCGRFAAYASMLGATCWEQFDSATADLWLSLFERCSWEQWDEGSDVDALWRAYAASYPAWHGALLSLPLERKGKFIQLLRDHTWDDPAKLRASVPYLLALQVRLCQPPFSATPPDVHLLPVIAQHLPVAGWQRLAATADRPWRIIEQASRRGNDTVLISRGLGSLALCWPDLALQALEAAPRRLMRCARVLGCLAYERRRQFLAESSHQVWFATDWAAMAPEEACRLLSRLCRESGLNSPVPRRLREHQEGAIVLSARQVARHCKVSLARLPGLQLAALERLTLSNIDRSFNLYAHSSAASHALRLLASLDKSRDNRKGLRRFLSAYGQGRTRAHLDHPLNRRWFARHPRIDEALWSSHPLALPVDGIAQVRIALETDPLEVLMLGTYVGTCLGLGGRLEYSAVACLLDANKQVIYARDNTGRVLARQLLAIDEQDRLVCFEIYPDQAGEVLIRAFHAYHAALAEALGIRIYRGRDEEEHYRIPTIVAQYWWDDDAPDYVPNYAPDCA